MVTKVDFVHGIFVSHHIPISEQHILSRRHL